MTEYKDKTIKCLDCGTEFTFSARDQEFYAEKGFTNEPKRCKACRDARKQEKRYLFVGNIKEKLYLCNRKSAITVL